MFGTFMQMFEKGQPTTQSNHNTSRAICWAATL